MRRIVLLVVFIVLGSCGGGGAVGDVSGEELFALTVLEGQAGCVTCHSLGPGRVLVGPSPAGVGGRAATRVPGQSAAQYLRTSIVMPDAYAVEGFDSGRMPSNWADVLSEREIDAIVDHPEDL